MNDEDVAKALSSQQGLHLAREVVEALDLARRELAKVR